MSGGRQGSGSKATVGQLPTQKMKGHHSFSSSTQDSVMPGSIGKPYVDGSNVAKGKALGKASGTKGRPDNKGKTPNVQNGVAAGSGKSGWKNNDWS